MSSISCPCCGAPVDTDALVIDLPSNVVVYNNKIIRLQPRGVEMLWVMHQAWPSPVPHSKILHKVWANSKGQWDESAMSVSLSYLRKALRKVEIEIIGCRSNDGQERALRLKLPFTPGVYVHPGIRQHGTNYGYCRGCRCEECCKAHRDYQRVYARKYYRQRISKSGRWSADYSAAIVPQTRDPKTGRYTG